MKKTLSKNQMFISGIAYVIVLTIIANQFIKQSRAYFAEVLTSSVVVIMKEKQVNIETEPTNPVMAERIIKICKDNGLTADADIKWVLGKLWNESNWKQYANNVNIHKQKDGTILKTLDRGISMWNDYYHPEVSDECAYTPECAIAEMIKYRKDGKDIWVASDNL